uniref:purine-nucleoside phosphorylase n=1 Tax=Pararhizobium sp. IMCC3301 TaxID=3067904 RepID=UPI00274045E8|nr:purine-nucleoside phosphorylase [Pararhizobium sp. IMCC3301]
MSEISDLASAEATDALRLVRQSTGRRFSAGLILGSGLGGLADMVENRIEIPFTELPGFPASGVSGHAGMMIAGDLAGLPVVLYSGRSHFYEQEDAAVMRRPIALMKALGCDMVVLTNSAGSLHPKMAPGSAMLITDHINFSGSNPLFRESSDRRFVGLTEAYDKSLRDRFDRIAERQSITLHHGVYMWFSGPSFETPAEINMARIVGADAVGMSTVPEAILARFFDMRVVALSAITNLAAGMTGQELSHDETKENAPKATEKLKALIGGVLEELART